jgi:hypothetical protein
MTPPAQRARELLLLLGLFAAICWPLISSSQPSNYRFDELNYHLPAVRQISDRWPQLDLVEDSLSATAPGYHYVLATVAQLVGHDVQRMRVVNWSLSAGLLAMIYLYARRRLPYLDATLLVLPFAASNFFIKSASWIVTDNAALFLTAIALFAALKPSLTPGDKVGASLNAAAAVFVRQLTIWTIALPLASWIGGRGSQKENTRREFSHAALMSLPALLVLLALYLAWGGLVPPIWRETSLRLSTAGPIYLLSLIGLFGFVYLPGDALKQAFTPSQWRTTLAVFLAGALFSLTSETTHNHELGRWGGYLWSAGMWLPTVSGHSVLFFVLCGAGSLAVFLFWRGLRAQGESQSAAVFALGLAAWAATFVVNRQSFHRYFEPMILLFLIAIGPTIIAHSTALRGWRWRMAVCGFIQLVLTFLSAHASILFER